MSVKLSTSVLVFKALRSFVTSQNAEASNLRSAFTSCGIGKQVWTSLTMLTKVPMTRKFDPKPFVSRDLHTQLGQTSKTFDYLTTVLPQQLLGSNKYLEGTWLSPKLLPSIQRTTKHNM